jgi:hypothetical protein
MEKPPMYQLLIDEMVAYFRDHPEDLDSVALFVGAPIFAFMYFPDDVLARREAWSTTHPVWGAPAMTEQLAAVRATLVEAVRQNVEVHYFLLTAQCHALEHLGWRNASPALSA